MINNKQIVVIIPAYNEARQIQTVIQTIPDYVDRIVVVDDKSTDTTVEVVTRLCLEDQRVVLIEHSENQGCGGALASGYSWARDNGFDIAVRMDGDGQMNPADLSSLLEPVISGEVDYSKGNRLVTGEAFKRMPLTRYFGNAFLSLLTKIASGYWHVADFQSGYTVANRRILHIIDWERMYRRYGQPNDLLVRLNIENFKVRDIPVEPIYNIGEQSGLSISTVIFTISWLLIKMFFWRMKEKYIIRDFHPLVLFYFFGSLFGVSAVVLFSRVMIVWYLTAHIPPINALAAMFSFMSATQFTLFAMWFDMEVNKDLKG